MQFFYELLTFPVREFIQLAVFLYKKSEILLNFFGVSTLYMSSMCLQLFTAFELAVLKL